MLTKGFSREELDDEKVVQLPDRTEMSLVNANVAAPINAALALNVLSDNSTAIAYAPQTITFPTSVINVVWTQSPHEGNPIDESITFSSSEGAPINADLALNALSDGSTAVAYAQQASQIPQTA